ncbi:protein FAM90A1-like, partial [Sciurus carolinensis]|uniref:protein FAM90A1-like n=1 Tax=Sciurus carolinensis TaxID=30640 RepID=UPI001FB5015D
IPCSPAWIPSPTIHLCSKQSLRMVSRRLDNDRWSSQFITDPSFHSPEKTTLPAKNPPICRLPPTSGTNEAYTSAKGQGSHVPVSVLYEDLQVSSSFEDSD